MRPKATFSVLAVLVLGACRPASEPVTEGNGDDAGSGDAAVVVPEGDIAVWVGLHCGVMGEGSGSQVAREFSFYIDGVEAQRWESPCVGYAAPGDAPPNGGQFSVTVPPGIHVLRFQDDTIDAFSEERVQLSRSSWVFVHHRVLDSGGYMLSFDVRATEPRYVAQ
jgi:hypothetical protein